MGDDMAMRGRAKFHFDNLYEEMNRKIGPYIIYQVGDLCCEPGYHVESHEQKVYEISYIVSGCGVFMTNQRKFDVSKGMLLLNRIGEKHEIWSSELEPLRYFYLGFTFADLGSGNETARKLKEFFDDPNNRMVNNANGIQDLFIKLFTELITVDYYTEVMLETYLQQILVKTYRTFSQKKYHTYRVNDEDTDKKLVYDIVHYIDTETENIRELSELSRIFGYSYTNIAQKFLSVMGENLKSYYSKRRFEKAKENILKGYSITQIAEVLGYKSIHAFSRAFHNYTGMTPTDYKKWALENKEKVD